MKKLIFAFFLVFLCASTLKAQQKMSQDERAKLTPEQRIVYENSFKKKKGGKRKMESVKKKVKQAKKEDRLSRKIQPPPKNPNIKKKRRK